MKNRGSFLIAWGGDSLYLGIECLDSDMDSLNIGTTKDNDMNIWNGDVIEILVETQFHSYYQIAISPTGAVTDLDRSQGLNSRWASKAEVATHRGEDRWTVEIRLPAAGEDAKVVDPLVGIAGRKPTMGYPWYVNVCRARIRGGEKELSAWSPTGKPRFNVPEKFGKVWSK